MRYMRASTHKTPKSGKQYPEQSSRQAMRQHRVQQGGNGIILNPKTFVYEPRA